MDFWNGKKVLVTGHTGFKGSWLALWLKHLGANVLGVSLPPESLSLFEVANVGEGIADVRADIRRLDSLKDQFAGFQPAIVLHLAAQSLVRRSYVDPVETYETNVMGTLNLLEAVRSVDSVRAVVVVTTDKCYENAELAEPFVEDDPMGGFDPYSSSKGCTELLVRSYRQSYFSADEYGKHGVALATARAGNVIGGGDWAEDRLVPDLLRSAAAGEGVLIRNPAAIRPWQHVLEPLHGYMMLAEKLHTQGPEFGEAWNFGPGEDDMLPVKVIVEKLSSMPGCALEWRVDPSENPHEAQCLRLDCSKAHSRLAWRPRWNLDTALGKIAEWHNAHREGADMRAYCLQQIQQYSDEVT